jgi:DNA-binding transcriptional ArsR family regulator
VAQDQLDATFTALADPTRRAIVARLARGDATVNELAAPFDLTLPGISKHLKVLERSGIISRTRHAQFRPCHLEAGALEPAAAWIEDNRRIWAERFDKLDAHLRDLQRRPAGDPGRTPPGRPAPAEGPAPSNERSDQ